MVPTAAHVRILAATLFVVLTLAPASAQLRLTDESDRTAFRAWFALLADAQFDRPAPEVVDCAALVRFAFREALRAHTPDWRRRIGLPFAPQFPDVRSAPRPNASGWPLFRTAAAPAAHGEFADAKTIVRLNTVPLDRDLSALRPGDLLYFRQPRQRQPDHLMVFVGRSHFESGHGDWIVYHTGPDAEGPGEVRKTRLATLRQHPAARWRPEVDNRSYVGAFRLSALHTP